MRSFYCFIALFFITLNPYAQIVSTVHSAYINGGYYCDGTTNGATFTYPMGVCMDGSGNLYIADTGAHKIRKMTPAGVVTTLTGSTSGYVDGPLASAKFNRPIGIVMDAAGNLYVTDSSNNRIRKITPQGMVSTIAGSAISGYADGVGSAVKFALPYGICFDANGDLLVADRFNHKIRKVTPAGLVTTVAGSTVGYSDGTTTAAQFDEPLAIAQAPNGDFYICDALNNRIRKMTAAGVVTTFAGSGVSGTTDGQGTAAQFDNPQGIYIDSTANVFVVDYISGLLRKITPNGLVSTLAGGTNGFDMGEGFNRDFLHPAGVCVDAAGNMYVASEHSLSKVTPSNQVINMAGAIRNGSVDGTGTPVGIEPLRICLDPSGNVYMVEPTYNRIRKITPAGVVTSFAGSGVGGNINGVGVAAQLSIPQDLCYDALSGNIYVADKGNNSIRKITPNGQVSTFATGFFGPNGVCMDAAGNLYVLDALNSKVKKVTPAGVVSTVVTYAIGDSSTKTSICIDSNNHIYLTDPTRSIIIRITAAGVISTFAGVVNQPGDVNGVGAAARLEYPSNLMMGNDGYIYFVDSYKIKRLSLSGEVSTVVGSVSGDVDGQGAVVRINPAGLFYQPGDTLYFSEISNAKIKKMTGFLLSTSHTPDAALDVKLYPNPVQNTLNVELNVPITNARLIITDILGQKIYAQNLGSALSNLDISGFQKGVYFLTVSNADQTTTQKFIKE